MSAEFERIVRIKPAFDCEVIQPCVHGSDTCGKVRGASHGRNAATLFMTLRSEVAEVTLEVGTGWDRPETPARYRLTDGPRPGCVAFHSSMPQYEGHEPQGSTCDLWSACYGSTAFTLADEPTRLLVCEGSDAVWVWLEAQYRETFGALAASGDWKAGAR